MSGIYSAQDIIPVLIDAHKKTPPIGGVFINSLNYNSKLIQRRSHFNNRLLAIAVDHQV